MVETEDARRHGSISLRVALLSILGFWLFYFAIVTLRSAVLGLGEFADALARRSIVTVASAGATLLLYLVLRRLPRRSLGLAIAIAAMLAVPAALLHATVNWIAFRTPTEKEMAKKRLTKVIVVEGPGQVSPEPPYPTPPPSANGKPRSPPPVPTADMNRRITVQVGGSEADEDMSPIAQIADQAANGYFFMAAWAALYLALCYAAEVGVVEREAARFRAAAQAAEIRALRYQVNPHFLFNTLNSLSSLVMIGKVEQAERMILNLATFFRTSLTGDPTDDVRLDDEIRLQHLYLDIEAVRFPDRLRVAMDVPAALHDACVPGLILQPLVENAIKYGVSRAGRPVTVRIAAREEAGGLVLTVADDGPPAETPLPAVDAVSWDAEGAPATETMTSAGGTGVGLRNVRDRVAARFGEDGQVRYGPLAGGGFVVMLFMPLVRDAC